MLKRHSKARNSDKMKASSVVFLSILCSHPVLFQGGSVVVFISSLSASFPQPRVALPHKQTFSAVSSALCPSAALASTSNKLVTFMHPLPRSENRIRHEWLWFLKETQTASFRQSASPDKTWQTVARSWQCGVWNWDLALHLNRWHLQIEFNSLITTLTWHTEAPSNHCQNFAQMWMLSQFLLLLNNYCLPQKLFRLWHPNFNPNYKILNVEWSSSTKFYNLSTF